MKRKTYFKENKRFKTIQIKVYFPFKRNEEDFIRSSVCHSLLTRCNYHKTISDYSKDITNNYIIKLDSSFERINDTSFIIFFIVIPSDKYLKEIDLQSTFKFISDFIYKPYKYEQKSLKLRLDSLKRDIAELDYDIYDYVGERVFELIAPNTLLSSSLKSHKNDIDLVTADNLHNFYKEKVINNSPIVFIMGDTDKNKIIELSNKYLIKNNKSFILKDPNIFIKYNGYKELIEEKDFYQSFVSIVYIVTDPKPNDNFILTVLVRLLDSNASRIVSDLVRTQNDLAYQAGVRIASKYGLLSLFAFLNKEKIEKTTKVLKQALKTIENKELISNRLKLIKKQEKINLLQSKDSKEFIFNEFITSKFGYEDTLEEEYQKLLKVEYEDIIELYKRLKLCYKYIVKGVKDEIKKNNLKKRS